jgi:hypothetical protein
MRATLPHARNTPPSQFKPGPNANDGIHLPLGVDRNSFNTNINVGDDILPFARNTSLYRLIWI